MASVRDAAAAKKSEQISMDRDLERYFNFYFGLKRSGFSILTNSFENST